MSYVHVDADHVEESISEYGFEACLLYLLCRIEERLDDMSRKGKPSYETPIVLNRGARKS